MRSTLDLPEDVFLYLLAHVDFGDLGPLMGTSRHVHDFIKRRKARICKSMYLHHLDAPPHDLDWEQEIKDIALLSARVRDSTDLNVSPAEELSIGNTMLRLAKNASPVPGMSPFFWSPAHLPSRNVLFLSRLLGDMEVRDKFLHVSGIYNMTFPVHGIRNTSWDADLAISHLHCLYGRADSVPAVHDSRRLRAFAWADMKTYNPIEYTRRANWGPFIDELGEAVDWTRIEASMLVLARNTSGPARDRLGCMTREPPFSGSYRNSSVWAQLGLDDDPYGVTGNWTMVISALQARRFMFNGIPVPWPAIQSHFMRQTTTTLFLKLRATATNDAPGPHEIPTAHFEGSARFLHITLDVTGHCCMTAAGEVRWRLHFLRNGDPWKPIEAVQIGGLRSGRGAIGNWSLAGHNTRGVGPVAFWKTSPEIPNAPQSLSST